MNPFREAIQEVLIKLGFSIQGLSLVFVGVLVGYVMQVKGDVTIYLVIINVWTVAVVFTWSRTRYMSIIRAYQTMDKMYFQEGIPIESDSREFIDAVHKKIYDLYEDQSKEQVHQGVLAFFESDLLKEWLQKSGCVKNLNNKTNRVEG